MTTTNYFQHFLFVAFFSIEYETLSGLAYKITYNVNYKTKSKSEEETILNEQDN